MKIFILLMAGLICTLPESYARDGVGDGGGDEAAKYERAKGDSRVVGIVHPSGDRPETSVEISGDAAKLLYLRLQNKINEVELPNMVHEGRLFQVIGKQISCEKRVLFAIPGRPAATIFNCGITVDEFGALVN
jgi:hypothetical protein